MLLQQNWILIINKFNKNLPVVMFVSIVSYCLSAVEIVNIALFLFFFVERINFVTKTPHRSMAVMHRFAVCQPPIKRHRRRTTLRWLATGRQCCALCRDRITRRSLPGPGSAPTISCGYFSQAAVICRKVPVKIASHLHSATYLREIKGYHTWRAVYRRALLTAGQGEF